MTDAVGHSVGVGKGKGIGYGAISPASTEAIIVRDKIVAKMKNMPFFSTFNFTTNKATSIEPSNVPFAGVYFINEDLTPDGDTNAGEVRFRSMAMYGISVIVQNNDAQSAEYKLDEAWQLLTVSMFTDPKMYNWKNVGRPGEVAIQGFTRGNRSHQFGNAGADNATPIAELRFTLTCDLGTLDFPPVIEDDFKKMHIETRYPAGSDPAEVQQTTAEWDIEVDP
jgi:hypothetical protein